MPDSPGPRPPAYLVIEGLAAGYGKLPVISGVNVGVGFGEIVAVLGPNGAGKSTLLKTIVGVLTPLAGRVAVNDIDVTGQGTNRLVRLGVGYVPQVSDVFEALTVQENLDMGGYLLQDAKRRRRRDEVAGTFPALSRVMSRRASVLSGGERKMLGIARALMAEPKVLLLDEPTANLSPELSAQLLGEHVVKLAHDGTAVLLVEQKAMIALQAADWGYLMVGGSVQMSAPSQEILDNPEMGKVFMGAGASREMEVAIKEEAPTASQGGSFGDVVSDG